MMNCISTFEIKKRLNTQRILIVPCGWDQLSGKNSLWKKWISNIFLNTIFFSSGVFFVSEVPSEVRSPEWEWCSWWKVYLITGTGQGSVWGGGEVPWLVVLFLLCISSSFGLFSCVCPGPHQMLLCWWHGKLPHHLFLLGGLHQPGPCGARWALRTGSTSSPRSIQERM